MTPYYSRASHFMKSNFVDLDVFSMNSWSIDAVRCMKPSAGDLLITRPGFSVVLIVPEYICNASDWMHCSIRYNFTYKANYTPFLAYYEGSKFLIPAFVTAVPTDSHEGGSKIFTILSTQLTHQSFKNHPGRDSGHYYFAVSSLLLQSSCSEVFSAAFVLPKQYSLFDVFDVTRSLRG